VATHRLGEGLLGHGVLFAQGGDAFTEIHGQQVPGEECGHLAVLIQKTIACNIRERVGHSPYYRGESDLKCKILAMAEVEARQQAANALQVRSQGKLTIASIGDPVTGKRVSEERIGKLPRITTYLAPLVSAPRVALLLHARYRFRYRSFFAVWPLSG
jgi:hypothetical protein